MIFGVDASTERGHLAVLHEGEVLFQEEWSCPRGRGGKFFSIFHHTLQVYGNPQLLVVGKGPGSYSGLRMTAAAAEGFALATQVRLLGLLSIQGFMAENYLSIGNARGGVYFFAHFKHQVLQSNIELLSLEQLIKKRADYPEVPVFTSTEVPVDFPVTIAFPDALQLARLACRSSILQDVQNEKYHSATLEPVYLKPVHITPRNPNPPSHPEKREG